MDSKKIKLIVGFIAYNELTAKYLSYFLPNLIENVKDLNCEILVIDNSEDKNNGNIKVLNN